MFNKNFLNKILFFAFCYTTYLMFNNYWHKQVGYRGVIVQWGLNTRHPKTGKIQNWTFTSPVFRSWIT